MAEIPRPGGGWDFRRPRAGTHSPFQAYCFRGFRPKRMPLGSSLILNWVPSVLWPRKAQADFALTLGTHQRAAIASMERDPSPGSFPNGNESRLYLTRFIPALKISARWHHLTVA